MWPTGVSPVVLPSFGLFACAIVILNPDAYSDFSPMKTEPARTIAELKELRELTADENGAQRVAFTETWAKARAWLRKKLDAFCPDVRMDEAGNLWATFRGESPKALLIGGHIDSVPNGGWLDGSLNTLAGVEILRRIHARTPSGT